MEGSDELLKLKFYSSICALPNDTLPDVLKSHFGHLLRCVSIWNKANLPSEMWKQMCRQCFVTWNALNQRTKIIPSIKPGINMKRIMKKASQNKPLKPFQKCLLSKVHIGNWLVTTCLVCHKVERRPVSKPNSNKLPIVEIEVDDCESSAMTKTKKKKKKKDPLAGIIQSNPSKSNLDKTIDICDTPIYEVPTSLLNNKKIFPTESPSFIPLESSTPQNTPKNRRNQSFNNNTSKHITPYLHNKNHNDPMAKRVVRNPFATTFSKENAKNNKKKRLSSLHKLLDSEKKATKPSPTSLKDFLKRS